MRSIGAPARALAPAAHRPSKSRAAGLSIASNAALILLKVAAGAIAGSIAILTEAVHSAIDLLASVVAFFPVRKAEEPPDPSHPYGHEKVENLTAALEGVLILVGAAIISTSSPSTIPASTTTGPSAEIDRGRGGHREQDPEVAGVAVDQQQKRRDEADQHHAEPGGLGKSHVGIVTSVPDPTLTPELALRYLDELSTDIRAAVLLDGSGRLAAAHAADGELGGGRLAELAAELFKRADRAGRSATGFDGPVAQVEVTTAEGAVFGVRAEGWTIAVVAGRFVLPSLMFYDLRAVLSDLGDRAA